MSVPRGVIALGFVSLFMDVSSEIIHALLPVYLTTTLGASAAMVGLIEGLGQGTAQITKLFSGVLSDWIGQRKPLALLGYGLSALTKPIFALAGTADWILVARVADRFGKGIRGTPRDALVADIVPEESRAAAYGLRQSMDSFGAFAGPILAMFALLWYGATIPQVFALSILPAGVAVAILAFAVREPDRHSAEKTRTPLSRAALRELKPGLWLAIFIASLMTMARISDAFLILDAFSEGLKDWAVPMVLVVMNAVDSLTSWPAGVMADRIGKGGLLLAGFAVLAVANLMLGLEHTLGVTFLAIALWGLHMGLTQGLLAAMVADAAPAELRGTAFGLFNLATGIALILGNVAAGAIWAWAGPQPMFLAAATLAGLATLGGFLRR